MAQQGTAKAKVAEFATAPQMPGDPWLAQSQGLSRAVRVGPGSLWARGTAPGILCAGTQAREPTEAPPADFSPGVQFQRLGLLRTAFHAGTLSRFPSCSNWRPHRTECLLFITHPLPTPVCKLRWLSPDLWAVATRFDPDGTSLWAALRQWRAQPRDALKRVGPSPWKEPQHCPKAKCLFKGWASHATEMGRNHSPVATIDRATPV